jgi:AraC-like DNA-binding protein
MEYLRQLKNNNKIYCRSLYKKDEMQTVSDFTLHCVFGGNEQCSIGRRKLSIYNDSFLVLNKGTQYTTSTTSDKPVQSFSLTFDQAFVNEFYSTNRLNDAQPFDNPNTDIAFHNLNETLYPFKGDLMFTISHLKDNLEHGLIDETLINEYMYHCLENYARLYNEEICQKAEQLKFLNRGTKIEILRRLNLAKEYLYSNFDQDVSLEELAEYSCLSVNHLLRTFKQAFNKTPHQFLVDLRLQRARQLLKTTDYPVNEVVTIIGFECPSSFIRLFKKHFNTTPLHYRQSA